jgi:phosphatidylinositol glycan class Z
LFLDCSCCRISVESKQIVKPAIFTKSHRPLALFTFVLSSCFFALLAIALDTSFYRPEIDTILGAIGNPVITPLNNFVYNSATSNLSKHGIHPLYQHVVANLPQLLGPAYPLLFCCYRQSFRLYSAVSAILVLSLFPHQEARFLTPAIPLLLSSVRLPNRFGRTWIASWVVFNVIMGLLMGTYHQGGVVPAQIHISTQPDITHAFWWKTYSPPIWLLDGKKIQTSDLMGMPFQDVDAVLKTAVACGPADQGIVLAAPASAAALDGLVNGTKRGIFLRERWRYSRHVSLDDMDFEDEGVLGTLGRVFGRRGLLLWDVGRNC